VENGEGDTVNHDSSVWFSIAYTISSASWMGLGRHQLQSKAAAAAVIVWSQRSRWVQVRGIGRRQPNSKVGHGVKSTRGDGLDATST
jgi:hypothetical protein